MAANTLEAPRGPLDHADLRHFLRALRLQLWWRDALELAAVSITAGALVGAGLQLWPGGPVQSGTNTLVVSWVMLAAIALGTLLAVIRRPSVIRAARVADRQLSTASRLATAAEILEGRLDGRLARAQLADAWLTASAIRPVRAYPRTWRRVRVAIGLVIVSILLAGLSAAGAFTPLDLLGQGSAAQSAAAAAEAEAGQMSAEAAAAAEAQALAADTSANPASAAQTLEQLQAAAAQSQLAETALQRLADALRPTSAASDVGEALRRGDYDDAANRLVNLGKESDQLSRQSRRELAGALQRVAFDSARIDPPLAVAEERAARALNRQVYTEIRSALDNLAKAVGDAKKGIISQEALAQQLDQLQQQQQQMPGRTGAGGDDPEGYVGDTPGQHAERTGLVRGVNSTIQLPGPEGDPRTASHSGVGKEAGGDPLGDLASRLNVPPTDISVETFLANDQGRDKPSPGAPTVRISDTSQQGVRESGVAQPGDPVRDVAEQIVEPNTQRATVRAFFKSAGDASQTLDRIP